MGASLTEVDDKGRTPIQLAIEKNKVNIVSMLSDRKYMERFFFVPQLLRPENSYFNVGLFLILHICSQTICILLLLPCNFFFKF
jgi:hypothetical protein